MIPIPMMKRLIEKRYLSAWLSAWAFITFASASLNVDTPFIDNPIEFMKSVFDVADNVPPWSKTSLGLALAAILFLANKAKLSLSFRTVLTLLSTPIAFYLSLKVYPFEYYPEFKEIDFFPGHLLVACVGGFILASAFKKRSSQKFGLN